MDRNQPNSAAAREPATHFLGRYRILAELGQGGTANVSLAVAAGPGDFRKLVVLKCMKPQFTSEPGFSDMFMTEARLAARLNHPNIVQTNEVFSHEGVPVIVMEYLEGQTLAETVARSSTKFTLGQHLTVLSDALSGLHYSHELTDYDGKPLNVVHRDMTPHNLFVTFDGQVKILDFGIAKLSGSNVETDTGVIKGKLRYIPPEQIMGEPVDRRADIYSVGVMLWEAAVGRKMWKGLSDATIMNHVVNGDIPSAKAIAAGVPAALDRIINKALAPELADRYSTASELQAELDGFRAELDEQVRAKDIAATLSSVFVDVRTQTRELIEEQLKPRPKLHDDSPTELPDSARPDSASYAVSSHNRPSQSQGGGRLRFWLSAIAAVAAVAVLLKWQREAPPAPKARAPVTGSRAETDPAPAQPTTEVTRISITAFPAHAQLRLGDTPLESNPYTLRRPRGPQVLNLSATAKGYRTELRELSLEQDADVVIHLSPVSASPRTAQKPPEERKPTPAREDTRCQPPFIIDDRGIKRFKPECMQ